MPFVDVWIHEYADAMFPVAHPRSRSSQSMSACGLNRSVSACVAPPFTLASMTRAASMTAAVEYAQHPAHLPWWMTSPKSTLSDQSKWIGRFVPSGPSFEPARAFLSPPGVPIGETSSIGCAFAYSRCEWWRGSC